MNKMQKQVAEFHNAFGATRGDSVGFHSPELRKKLLQEEFEETIEAIDSGNLVETIDGLCDLLYIIFGTADVMNIDLEPFFDEVHGSNMAKLGGGRRADGKFLKPEGWTPPDISGLLSKLYNIS